MPIKDGVVRFGMFTTFYPPYNFGGDGIGVQRLARALVRRGCDVAVVHDVDAYNALATVADPIDEGGPDGVRRIPIRSGVGLLSPLLNQQIGRPVITRGAIERVLRENRFDVVWLHNVSLIGGPGMLSVGKDVVRVYEAHEHWLVCPTHVLWRHAREVCDEKQCLRCVLRHHRPPQVWRYSDLLRRHGTHVHAFIAKSEFSRRKHQDFGFPFPMEVVPYFLPDVEPPRETSPPHPRPFFLFVGRLEKIKGLDDVIPVFANYPDADLVIAGDGEYAPTLKRLASGIENVVFLGRMAPDALAVYYRNAIGLIVPSVCYETFGIILIESFRQGTPVVARHIGPFPEIIEKSGAGETFVDVGELRQAIERFQQDVAYRKRLGASAREAFVTHWSEEAVMPQYLEVVRRAAAENGYETVAERLVGEMSS